MNKNNQILVALLTGAAVGTAVGMLLAPDKGSKTRKGIADKARKIQDDLKHQSDSLATVIDEVRHAATDVISTLKDTGGMAGNNGNTKRSSEGSSGTQGKSSGNEGNQ